MPTQKITAEHRGKITLEEVPAKQQFVKAYQSQKQAAL